MGMSGSKTYETWCANWPVQPIRELEREKEQAPSSPSCLMRQFFQEVREFHFNTLLQRSVK